MTPKQLLQECERLTHSGRMRRMVEIGQLAASDASVAETLTVLAQGDMYQRILATQACYGSRDSAQVLRALTDPSHGVRSLALGLTPLICSDAEIQTLLDLLPFAMKVVVLRSLSQRLKYAPIDIYLERLAARGSEELGKLLAFGSRAVSERYLGQVSARFDLVSLRRLARQHPDLIAAQLRTRAVATKSIDPQLIIQVNEVLPLLADRAPDLAIDLVKILITVVSLARLKVQPLVLRRPNEIVDLLLQSDEQTSLDFDEVAQRLDTKHLLILFTRYPDSISTECFDKLRSQQRFEIYAVCERGWRDSDGILEYHIVAALSAEQRLEEGHRHLALPALLSRPQERLRYAAFLSWDEARAVLDAPLRSPDADLRGVALQTLIAATRYQRGHLIDILQFVRNRRNEQDPVRAAIFNALADLPHGIWRSEHLDDLAQIMRDAFNATDLSPVTARAIESLVVYIFPFHPEWSANQLANVYRERGLANFYQLDEYLSEGDVRILAPILTPILRSWQQREATGALISLAQALGRRIRVFDEFMTLLEDGLKETLNNYYVTSILNIFCEHRRELAARLIPDLLMHDKSVATLGPVYNYLHRHRQDLITPFLGQSVYKGRFSTGQTRFVLPLDDGFQRWLPAQQELFARTLLEIIDEKDQNRASYELLSTINRLALMPAIDPAPIIKFASDERQLVRDAALRALGRLDAGQGIPTLLDALNDDRARIAIYALRKAFLSMSKEDALDMLRTVPLTRVTVAKEVVRLIGDLSSELAYRELLSMETRELHRDVRVALLHALWSYTEQAETWVIFARAAQSSDTAIAQGVIHIPVNGMSPRTQHRLALLTATLLDHPDPEVRMEVLKWRSQYPLTDTGQILFSHLLALMNSAIPDECTHAARVIFAIYTGNDAALVGGAVRDLLNNRRALQITIDQFTRVLAVGRRRLLPTLRAVLAVLSEDPLTLSLRIDLIVGGLPWEEVASALADLVPMLHAKALGTAQNAIQQAHRRPEARLLDLEMALKDSPDEGLRLLAFAALIAQSKQASGWTDACIARLQTYREDRSPMIAEAAQFTFIS
jgi:hypothetical protein